MNPPEFDLAAAHRYFAAQCFNRAWELIDKRARTPDEDEQMLQLNQASIWHWTQRSDCQPKHLSIGYWQASRIHAILDRGAEARRYAELCLAHTPEDDAFLMGYAHEALSRAASKVGDAVTAAQHFEQATKYAGMVSDDEDRRLLMNDLDSL
jgi:hypothetical protein